MRPPLYRECDASPSLAIKSMVEKDIPVTYAMNVLGVIHKFLLYAYYSFLVGLYHGIGCVLIDIPISYALNGLGLKLKFLLYAFYICLVGLYHVILLCPCITSVGD